jgi:23S rRNA-/tRNA-specific pseudouridylate synthase
LTAAFAGTAGRSKATRSLGGRARLVHLGDRFAVVDKPPGLSLATPRDRPEEAAARLVGALPPAERVGVEGRELRLVHRLDAPTSGLVLIAFDAALHRALATAFAERRVGKVYLALVWGRPRPAEGSFTASLGPDRADRRRMRADPSGRPAHTDYRRLGARSQVALVALWPRTGRTHQLRVHLAAAGHPIVGDDLYGGPRHRGVRDPALRAALAPPRALLHAWRLEVPELEPARFEVPPPPDFAAALSAAGLALADPGHLWQPPDRIPVGQLESLPSRDRSRRGT